MHDHAAHCFLTKAQQLQHIAQQVYILDIHLLRGGCVQKCCPGVIQGKEEGEFNCLAPFSLLCPHSSKFASYAYVIKTLKFLAYTI